jgi:hypothetical protein
MFGIVIFWFNMWCLCMFLLISCVVQTLLLLLLPRTNIANMHVGVSCTSAAESASKVLVAAEVHSCVPDIINNTSNNVLYSASKKSKFSLL